MGFIISKNATTEITDACGIEVDLQIRNEGKAPEEMEYFVSENPEQYKIVSEGLVKIDEYDNRNKNQEKAQIKAQISKLENDNVRSSQEVLAAMIQGETPNPTDAQAVVLRRKIIDLYRSVLEGSLESVEGQIAELTDELEKQIKKS